MGGEEDNWTAFSAPSDREWTQLSSTCEQSPFKGCFPLVSVSLEPSQGDLLHVSERCWSGLITDSLHPSLPLLSLRSSLDPSLPLLDLPADSEGFDWTTESRCEVLPTLFKPAKPESPIDINFDHSRAALGLSSLAVEELQVMCAEMRSKFGQLSRTLVEGLEERDSWAGELDAKNRFVVALLKVQAMRMSQRTVKEEKKYLNSVIPYRCPDGLMWTSQFLNTLTTILTAIAADSSTVPQLVADYIQQHIIEAATVNTTTNTHKHKH